MLKVKVLVTQSFLTLCDLWTVACQASLSMEFSRQEPWTATEKYLVIAFVTAGMVLEWETVNCPYKCLDNLVKKVI